MCGVYHCMEASIVSLLIYPGFFFNNIGIQLIIQQLQKQSHDVIIISNLDVLISIIFLFVVFVCWYQLYSPKWPKQQHVNSALGWSFPLNMFTEHSGISVY